MPVGSVRAAGFSADATAMILDGNARALFSRLRTPA